MGNSDLRRTILNELDEHICGKEYIGVISRLAYMDIARDLDKHLTRDEWHLILGLWYKNINKQSSLCSEECFNKEYEYIHQKLEELHKSYLPNTSELVSGNYKNNPDFYKESVFYESDFGYDFQYISFLNCKYAEDADWLLTNMKIKLSKIPFLFTSIRRKLILKAMEMNKDKQITLLNSMFCINLSDLIDEDGDYEEILNVFSFDLNNAPNLQYECMEQISLSMEKPIVKLDSNTLYIPCSKLLAQSFYEVPFYWIFNDKRYYDISGSKHRGDSGVFITQHIFQRIFDDSELYMNINVYYGKNTLTDIDYLVLYDNTVIVLQVKSKRYTLNSRQGDLKSIEDDYKKSVSDALLQAIKCEKAILSKKCHYQCEKNNVDAKIFDNVTEVFKLCITLDPVPAKETLIRTLSDKQNPPIVMSVFELDMVVRLLMNADDFIKYLKSRTASCHKIVGDNEASFLSAFLLEQQDGNLFSKYNLVHVQPLDIIDDYMNKTLLAENIPDIFLQLESSFTT